MGDEAIHAGHCSAGGCAYGDPQCPRVRPDLPGGRAGDALAQLRADGVEYAVRAADSGWVYALPKLLPKFLEGRRGTQEAAQWHRRQLAGPDPEDWTGFEIVRRPVGAWEVAGPGS